MKEIVRIKEADGSKALGFSALLTRIFENTTILLEEELDQTCVFADYHPQIMEDIQALQTLGSTHTTQLRGIANTQNLHERCISGLERDLSSIGGTMDRIERHLLGPPAELVPPPILPSRPRPRAHLGPDLGSGNDSDSE
ncbi:hypothetical protein Dimus_030352 [Dionaea muscipula]